MDVAIGSDGFTMLAVNSYEYPHLSTDGGHTWTDITNLPSGDQGYYFTCAIGGVNRTFLIGDYYGYVYLSTDGGSTWTYVPGHNEGIWGNVSGVSIAGDNQTMVLCEFGGRCFKTSNAWVSYSEIRPIDNADYDWSRIAVSYDGSTILASIYDGRIYLSTDGGAIAGWSETRPQGDENRHWSAVAVGYDGQKLYAAEWDDGVFRSEDGGATWASEHIGTGPSPDWDQWAIQVGQGDDYWGVATGRNLGGFVIFRGAYSPYVPPDPPSPPGELPRISRWGIEASYSRLRVHEAEILRLPTESDFLDID